MYHDNYPVVFQVHLDNGTLSGSVYRSSSQFSLPKAPVISSFEGGDSVIIVYFGLIWNTTTGMPTTTYDSINGAALSTAISQSYSNGMIYLASGSLTPLNILKFYFDDPAERSTRLNGTSSFSVTDLYQYVSDSSIGVTDSPISVSLTDHSTTVTDVDDYHEISKNTNDIVYVGGKSQVTPIQSGHTGNVSFDYFCSKSGVSITTSIYNIDQEFDAASKMRIDQSNAYLRVEGPRVSSDTNYSYGISYVDGSKNITSENILAVYTCGLSDCVTCEYNTRNSSCSQ